MKKKIALLSLLCMMCLCVFGAINVSAAAKPVIHVMLKAPSTTKEITYRVGDKLQLVSHLSVSKTITGVQYSSSKPSVASVNKSGVISLRKAGKATITVKHKYSKRCADLTINVTKSNTLCDLANQYGSEKNYFIHVNKHEHMVYVMRNKLGEWIHYKAFPCCVGAPSTPTPSGLFSIKSRGTYFWTGNCKCWYFTQIVGSILFHSQIYSSANSPISCVDDSMGISCSHGCIRLQLNNAYWVYKRIPRGTKVLIA